MLFVILGLCITLIILMIVFHKWADEADNYYSYSVKLDETIAWNKQHPFKKILYSCSFNEGSEIPGFAIGIIGIVISIIMICIMTNNYVGHFVIDDKIALYESENMTIEQRIDDVISNYQEYEQETFSSFKTDSIDIVFSMYPELKSNELITKQIEIYMENNKKIKELKEEKLNCRVYKWWLFF